MSDRRRRLGHDTRALLLALCAGLPGIILTTVLLWLGDYTPQVRWTLLTVGGLAWIGLSYAVREHVVRPLGTLANMLAALREGDFSIRARVVDATDPLSLVFHEVNALEETLRDQRLGAVEATETLRKVLEEIDVAVFAFDPADTLRIVNRAAERLLGQESDRLIGQSAEALRLDETLRGVAPRTVEVSFPGGTGRWELRRSVVRQEGYRLRLVALSDLSRALREEERQAWKRIIRVLSHEINNSLTPIKSISGSLGAVLARADLPEELDEDVQRGLGIVVNRAESLGRFMASYARLARLPEPEPVPVSLTHLLRTVTALETRAPIEVDGGDEVTLEADPDQLEQALINIVRNAVDATLSVDGPPRAVRIRWMRVENRVDLFFEDEGPGLADTANLFVPFYTTKPGGSGIGLILSRQIVEAHGGTLTLEDRSDLRGARARLSLPLPPRPS